MMFQVKPSMDPALLLTLRNGLAALRGEPIEGQRREIAIGHLVELFADADKIGDAMATRNVMFAFKMPQAFERYTLFSRYLRDSFPDLQPRLVEANQTLDALRRGKRATKADRERTAELVQALFNALRLERNLTTFSKPGILTPA